MTEHVENLILEHLRAIRSDIAAMKDNMHDVKHRLNSIESGIATLRRESSNNYGEIIDNRHMVDKLIERIERIEHRLALNP